MDRVSYLAFGKKVSMSVGLAQLGIADDDISITFVENLELSEIPSYKTRVGQKIAFGASPTARDFFIVTFFFLVHSRLFFTMLLTNKRTRVMRSESDFYS